MKKRLLNLLFPFIALFLEILPYGAVCVFASSPTERIRKTFSYFDLTPFGYANFGPLITALLTCVIIVLLLICLFTGKGKWVSAAKYVLGICVVISLTPLAYGIQYFSPVGALITVTLTTELLLLCFTGKPSAQS